MKTRIISAAVLIALLVVVLLAPTIVGTLVVSVLSAIAAYEIMVGTGFVKHIRLIVYSIIAASFVPLWCYGGMQYWHALLGIMVYLCLMLTELLISKAKLPFSRIALSATAGLLIPFLLSSMVRLLCMESGRILLLIPFVLACISDAGAYFIGCAWGKHKLAPTISPKKSVEGMIGGLVSAIIGMPLYCLIASLFCDIQVNYWYAMIYGLLGSLAGVFGDLCFSAIKRQAGVKDYGNLIPGHGGVLDRFDSMIIVAPLVELLLVLLPVLE